MAGKVLRGVNVLCDATTEEEKQRICKLVASLGGTVCSPENFKKLAYPKMLVADSVLTDAYKVCSSISLQLPRMKPSWLEACSEVGGKVSYRGHDLRVFTGLSASISGAYAKEKLRYTQLFSKYGGLYTPELTRQCSHLIIMKREEEVREEMSSKELHARVWGDLFIVWEAWIVDTIKAGIYTANEADYEVPGIEGYCLELPEMPLEPARQPGQPSIDTRNSSAAKETSHGTLPTIGTRVVQSAAPGQAASDKPQEPAEGVDLGRRAVAKAKTEGAPLKGPSKNQIEPVEVIEATRSASEGGTASSDEEEDTLFLSGALVHLACCTPAEQLEMLRILREGGCTRRPDLRHDVTHVVVGSDLTAAEVQAVTDHAKKFGHVSSITRLGWLRQCLAERSLLPVKAEHALSAQALGSMMARQKAAVERAVPDAAPQSTQVTQSRATQPAGQAKGCLSGFFFTLSALKVDGADEKYCRKAIRQAGGRLFDHRTLDLVTAKERAFAICPPSLPQPELTKLMKQNTDFRLVPEKNRVTPSWLDISLDEKRPLAPIPYERVELQPLAHPVPILGMKKVTVTASNLTHEEKDSIKRIVNILGGQYTVKMGFKNTHLVVPYAAGDKYEGAVRYNVLPVTHSWLIDVAKTGKMLPGSKYKPPPLEGGERPEASQFPFEAAAGPTQDPVRHTQAAVRASQATSLLRQVMASSQQQQKDSKPGAGGWKAKDAKGAGKNKQGPSRLDSLFSQLQTPVKGLRAPNAAPSPKITPKAAAQDANPIDNDQLQSQGSGGEGDEGQELKTASELAAQICGQGMGSADEMADILEDVERLGGALAELPHQVSPSSQQDPLMPYHRARMPTPSASSGGDFASRGDSPPDGRSRPKRSSRRGDSVSEDSHPGRDKRTRNMPRHPRANSENLPQDFQSSQAYSQEVGYEGVIKAGQPYMLGSSRDLRSSRMGRSSSSGARSLE